MIRSYDEMSIPEFADESLFDRFFTCHHSRMVLYAEKFTEDTETARDIVQEVFLKTWENRDKISINSSLLSYLYVAIRNRCASFIRQKALSEKFTSQVESEMNQLEIDFYSSEEEQHLLIYEKETGETIRKTISELPEKCREIFELSRYQGMKSSEIAQKLNISVRTVETQIYRALKYLKERLLNNN